MLLLLQVPGAQHPPQAQSQLGNVMGPFATGHAGQIVQSGPGVTQRPPPTQGYAMGPFAMRPAGQPIVRF